jgi:hypothetical protein
MTAGHADDHPAPVDQAQALTLPDVLTEHRRSRPGGRALVCGEVRMTYA